MRLALEVAVIHSYARHIVALLQRRDPLSERVHLGKAQFALYGLSRYQRRRRAASARSRLPAANVRKRDDVSRVAAAETHDSAASARRAARSIAAMRIMPRGAARGDVRDLFVLPRGRRHRGSTAARATSASQQLKRWRADIDALYAGSAVAARSRPRRRRSRRFGLEREDFQAVIDGMEMDAVADIRAPDCATLDLYCDRVASAVGRLSVRIFGMDEEAGIALAHHLGRALQLTNILRDLDEDAAIGRLYLPREALRARRHHRDRAGRRRWRIRASRRPARRWSRRRTRAFRRRPTRSWRHARAAPCARRASWRRPTARSSTTLIARGFARAARAASACRKPRLLLDRPALRDHLMPRHRPCHRRRARRPCRRGPARAAQGERVVVHEAARQAGGRCRSYHDPQLDMTIDNGNHLLLSGNHAALGYLRRDRRAPTGSIGPDDADFPFVDLQTGERWTLRINDGRDPWWIFDASRRVAGHAARATIWRLAQLLRAGRDKPIGDVIDCAGPALRALAAGRCCSRR